MPDSRQMYIQSRQKYNFLNEDLSRRIPQYYRTYISKFPFKLFGNNPTLKQLENANKKNLEKIVVNL